MPLEARGDEFHSLIPRTATGFRRFAAQCLGSFLATENAPTVVSPDRRREASATDAAFRRRAYGVKSLLSGLPRHSAPTSRLGWRGAARLRAAASLAWAYSVVQQNRLARQRHQRAPRRGCDTGIRDLKFDRAASDNPRSFECARERPVKVLLRRGVSGRNAPKLAECETQGWGGSVDRRDRSQEGMRDEYRGGERTA